MPIRTKTSSLDRWILAMEENEQEKPPEGDAPPAEEPETEKEPDAPEDGDTPPEDGGEGDDQDTPPADDVDPEADGGAGDDAGTDDDITGTDDDSEPAIPPSEDPEEVDNPFADTVEEVVVDADEDGVPLDTSATTDAAKLNYVEAKQDLDEAKDDLDDVVETSATLESLAIKIEAAIPTGGLSPIAARSINRQVNAQFKKLGVPATFIGQTSMENFYAPSTAYEESVLTCESIVDFVKEIYGQLKAYLKNIGERFNRWLHKSRELSKHYMMEFNRVQRTARSIANDNSVLTVVDLPYEKLIIDGEIPTPAKITERMKMLLDITTILVHKGSADALTNLKDDMIGTWLDSVQNNESVVPTFSTDILNKYTDLLTKAVKMKEVNLHGARWKTSISPELFGGKVLMVQNYRSILGGGVKRVQLDEMQGATSIVKLESVNMQYNTGKSREWETIRAKDCSGICDLGMKLCAELDKRESTRYERVKALQDIDIKLKDTKKEMGKDNTAMRKTFSEYTKNMHWLIEQYMNPVYEVYDHCFDIMDQLIEYMDWSFSTLDATYQLGTGRAQNPHGDEYGDDGSYN